MIINYLLALVIITFTSLCFAMTHGEFKNYVSKTYDFSPQDIRLYRAESAEGSDRQYKPGYQMKDVLMTEVVQSAYDRAKSDLDLGSLPITNIQDLCHVAYSYALIDLYQGSKKPDQKKHYNKPIDKLYKLFDNGTLSEKDTYASFAFCYLKVFEVEGVLKKRSFLAQFEHEKEKYA